MPAAANVQFVLVSGQAAPRLGARYDGLVRGPGAFPAS